MLKMTMTTITSMKFRIAFFFLFIWFLPEMRYYSSIFRQNVYLPPKKRRESLPPLNTSGNLRKLAE